MVRYSSDRFQVLSSRLSARFVASFVLCEEQHCDLVVVVSAPAEQQPGTYNYRCNPFARFVPRALSPNAPFSWLTHHPRSSEPHAGGRRRARVLARKEMDPDKFTAILAKQAPKRMPHVICIVLPGETLRQRRRLPLPLMLLLLLLRLITRNLPEFQ